MSELSLPVVTIYDGVVTTLSTNVAEFFGKLHKDVIRSIETILKTTDEKHKRNFAPMMIDVEIGNGATRKSKAYRLTRDGFTFLAMGFTGERAQSFKWAYIDAFNRMETQLMLSATEKSSEVATITPEQQYLLKEAVNHKAKMHAAHYQTIYRAIYARYKIARYDQLPKDKFKECLQFITEINPNIPINPDRAIVRPERCPVCGLIPVPEGSKVFTRDDQKKIAEAIRPLLQDAMDSMRKIEEERSHAWTCFHEISLYLCKIC